MKKLILIATIIASAAVASWAGGACCPGGKSKATSKSYDNACTRPLAGMELTEEQKAKIAEIEAACKAEGCSKAACDRAAAQIREVLTDDQRQQYDAKYSKASKKDC